MTADGRDVAAEMRAVIDAHTSDGPYVPRAVAGEIVEKLRAYDPDLLAAWLDAQAEHFIWQMINDRDRSVRSRARATCGRAAFAEAAAEQSDGPATSDISPKLRKFLHVPFTVGDGRRLPLGQMGRSDLVFVADGYGRRARDNTLMAAFMKALSKKVKTGVVADYFDDEQLTAMFESIAA